MTTLGLNVSIETVAKANSLRWFGHVVKAEDNCLKMALNYEVRGKEE